jgi:hypothetical protein
MAEATAEGVFMKIEAWGAGGAAGMGTAAFGVLSELPSLCEIYYCLQAWELLRFLRLS